VVFSAGSGERTKGGQLAFLNLRGAVVEAA
jgi:hypothetical protein